MLRDWVITEIIVLGSIFTHKQNIWTETIIRYHFLEEKHVQMGTQIQNILSIQGAK